ncbi:conserved hypothetical protein [Stutzerimonas stutzeri A1501]|uniref:Uncharacterized protein n=1 Tax=Stutzerimonas stutzeri (strain A1501) TaxID=379731 RepID=A4VPD8_STUS1|nr:conserved hypothetical protein [Stutzerimonas stutzeri A1501]
MGVNGALRRVLTRSVLACGCAPLRLARPPLTPTTRESAPMPSRFSRCRWISLARKLPVQEWHGYHAASAQVADKAEGRVSAIGRGYVRVCRSALIHCTARMPRDGPSLRAAVTAPPTPPTIRAKARSYCVRHT